MRNILLLINIIILNFGCINSQNNNSSNFEFPKSKMGEFAEIWFDFVNSGTKDKIQKYDKDMEWEEHLSILRNLSQSVNGITPFLISYETDNVISIYSKENEGAWVKVNLGLNRNDEITDIGIKKSSNPINYDLINKLTKEQIHDIVDGISNELQTNYVIEDLRLKYSTELLQLLESGKYNSITQGDLLADILTEDLIKISNDKHLQIIPPSRVSEVEKRFGIERHIQKSKLEDALPTHISTLDDENITSQLLNNNVGYISLNRFVDNEKTIIATQNIFQSFVNTKAIIIDLRFSGGGDASAVTDLLAYFISEEDINISFPELIKTKELKNVSHKDNISISYIEKPLFVLTSVKTISAGEAFAYYLQKKERATIIGENTAGAGYRVDAFKLPYNFFFVNSIFTTFDINKGEGWQGDGIKPDISTLGSEALDIALSKIK